MDSGARTGKTRACVPRGILGAGRGAAYNPAMQRLLFISSNRVGDAVLSSGVLAWALERWPEARVTVAAGPAVVGLFEAVPRLERLIPMPKRRHSAHWPALWGKCFGRVWTALLDTRNSATRFVLPARRRFVMAPERRGQHKVVQASRMVVADGALDPRIYTAPEHDAAAATLMPGNGPVLAIAPLANWGGKVWPVDRFRSLVDDLTGPAGRLAGARVAVLSAPAEREAALAALSRVPEARRIDLAGKTDLLTAYACLARADLFVGNDSALMHLAAAAGTPTVGLFGPSREEWYGPWGTRAAAVRTDRSYDAIVASPGFDWKSGESRMTDLPVGRVAAAAARLLDDAAAEAAQ